VRSARVSPTISSLADIYESIDELKYYREHFLKG